MALQPTSRYNEGQFLWVYTVLRRSKQTVFLNTILMLTAPYEVHVVREGDNIQLLASLYFGDPFKWHIIADANPHVFNPWDLRVGDQLRIMR